MTRVETESEAGRGSIGARSYCLVILIGTAFQDSVRDAVDKFIPFVEAIGASVIAIGVVVTALVYLMSELRIRPVAYEHVRLLLGRFLALGLEFQLAADILKTAVSPTWTDIEQLAAIAAIRTVLNYFLAQEVEKAAEMEAHGMLAMPGEVPEPKPRAR